MPIRATCQFGKALLSSGGCAEDVQLHTQMQIFAQYCMCKEIFAYRSSTCRLGKSQLSPLCGARLLWPSKGSSSAVVFTGCWVEPGWAKQNWCLMTGFFWFVFPISQKSGFFILLLHELVEFRIFFFQHWHFTKAPEKDAVMFFNPVHSIASNGLIF